MLRKEEKTGDQLRRPFEYKQKVTETKFEKRWNDE